MTNQQILKKAIEKAESNIIAFYKDGIVVAQLNKEHPEIEDWKNSKSVFEVIFSHSFAKAYFPKGWTVYKQGHWQDCDERQTYQSESPFVFEKWQFHLQQMVLLPDDEKLKYLEKFL